MMVFILAMALAGSAYALGRAPRSEPLPVPQNVQVWDVSDHWYSISWDSCGTSGWYRIDLKEISPNGNSTMRNQSVNGRQFDFSSLKSGHKYRVSIRYQESQGGRAGDPSQAVTFFTAPESGAKFASDRSHVSGTVYFLGSCHICRRR